MGATKTNKKIEKLSCAAVEVAKICNKSPRYVRMVDRGERSNSTVLAALEEYRTGSNKLVKAVEKIVKIA